MAIFVIFKTNKITKEMYEELRKEVNWEYNYPDGEALHVSGYDNLNNFCVAGFWESEEHLNNFINYRLLLVMQKINMPMPEGRFFK